MVAHGVHIPEVQVQFLVPQWRAVQWSGCAADIGETTGSSPVPPISGSGAYADRQSVLPFVLKAVAYQELPESPLARDASLSNWRSGVQFPSGALRNRCRRNAGIGSTLAVAVEMERSFSPLGTGSHSPSLHQFPGHVSGDRRVEALLRQELAGSNPVGGPSIENIPDKGSTRVLPTPDPAPTVSRSPALITWPTSWSHPSPQEPEIRVQIPAVELRCSTVV
jgi:hypothetical protein